MSQIPTLPVPRDTSPTDVFVGLMPRLSALLIDTVIIYFVGYTLDLALRRPLLGWGPWLPLVSTLGAFCYFWLGNGPVGGGATFGKAILNLHVVDARGEKPLIPGYGAAFKRALVQFPLVYLALFQFGREVFGLPPFYGALGDGLVRLVVIALIVTHGYAMLTHPQKATWYDLWAGVRVTRDPTPSEWAQRMSEAGEGTMARRAIAHRYFSRYFFAAVCLVLGLGLATLVRDPARRKNLELIGRISAETPLEGYRLEWIDYRSGRDFNLWMRLSMKEFVPWDAVGDRRREGLPAQPPAPGTASDFPVTGAAQSNDAPTSGAEPAPVLFLRWVKTRGGVDPAEMDRGLREQLEALRAAAPAYFADAEAIGAGRAPAPTRFVCFLTERFRFVIFSPGKGRLGVIEGPIDPGEGPLNDAWYQPAP